LFRVFSSPQLAKQEVPVAKLLPNRTYLFFSHTIKGEAFHLLLSFCLISCFRPTAQPYNMPLLDACLAQNIQMMDYEKIVEVSND
jgi:hypothetical protein